MATNARMIVKILVHSWPYIYRSRQKERYGLHLLFVRSISNGKKLMSITEEIASFCTENQVTVSFLPDRERSLLIFNIADKFKLDIDRFFIWEDVKTLGHLGYSDPIEWENRLNKYLKDFQKEIFVVITDENFYPWPVFKCRKQDLVRILENQRHFEYFLFDSLQQRLLFDTHHNTLVLC